MKAQWMISSAFFLSAVALLIYLGCGNQAKPNPSETVSLEASQNEGGLLPTKELVNAIKSLEGKIEKLEKTLRGHPPTKGKEDVVPKEGIPIKEESLVRLEKTVDKLINVVRSSPLSSDRNDILRAGYEVSRYGEPQPLKSFWESSEAAQKELFLMTYSRVLDRVGPPDCIKGGEGQKVYWYYPKGSQVQFIDGYVSSVFVEKGE